MSTPSEQSHARKIAAELTEAIKKSGIQCGDENIPQLNALLKSIVQYNLYKDDKDAKDELKNYKEYMDAVKKYFNQDNLKTNSKDILTFLAKLETELDNIMQTKKNGNKLTK